MIIKHLIEALLFSTPEPLTQAKLNQIIPDEDIDLREQINELNLEYEKLGKALYIEEIGGGISFLYPEII